MWFARRSTTKDDTVALPKWNAFFPPATAGAAAKEEVHEVMLENVFTFSVVSPIAKKVQIFTQLASNMSILTVEFFFFFLRVVALFPTQSLG